MDKLKKTYQPFSLAKTKNNLRLTSKIKAKIYSPGSQTYKTKKENNYGMMCKKKGTFAKF